MIRLRSSRSAGSPQAGMPRVGQSWTIDSLPRSRKKRARIGRLAGSALLLALAYVMFVAPTRSQQFQSGGTGSNASVSATGAAVPSSATYFGGLSAGNLTGVAVDASGRVATNLNLAGTAVSANNGLADAGTMRVTLASNSTGQVALAAGTNSIGKVVWPTGCGATAFDSGFVANIAITTGTDVATAATCVFTLFVSNTTGSAVTLTVKDKAVTPNTYISSFSIPANSNIVLPLWGVKLTGGITLIAGTASALQAQVVGLQ